MEKGDRPIVQNLKQVVGMVFIPRHLLRFRVFRRDCECLGQSRSKVCSGRWVSYDLEWVLAAVENRLIGFEAVVGWLRRLGRKGCCCCWGYGYEYEWVERRKEKEGLWIGRVLAMRRDWEHLSAASAESSRQKQWRENEEDEAPSPTDISPLSLSLSLCCFRSVSMARPDKGKRIYTSRNIFDLNRSSGSDYGPLCFWVHLDRLWLDFATCKWYWDWPKFDTYPTFAHSWIGF